MQEQIQALEAELEELRSRRREAAATDQAPIQLDVDWVNAEIEVLLAALDERTNGD